MADIPAELRQLRELWAELLKLKLKGVSQATLVNRTKTISHLVTDFGSEKYGVSGPYLSQLLNAGLERSPRRPMLTAVALGMRQIFDEKRMTLSDEDRIPLEKAFDALLTELRVEPSRWSEPDLPLEAYSSNLVVRQQVETTLEGLLKQGRFYVSLTGGYRQGKTTALARVISRCQTLGYTVTDVSVGPLALETGDAGDMVRRFAQTIALPEPLPGAAIELEQAVERWLSQRMGTVVLVVDDVNALMTAAHGGALVRTLFRGWIQKSQRAAEGSPWRRFNMVLASSYTPDIMSGSAVSSPSPATFGVNIPGFSPDETERLIRVWAAYRELDTTAAMPTDEQLAQWRGEIVTWFDGQPYLVHDYIRQWANTAVSTQPWSKPTFKITSSQRQYVDDLFGLMGTVDADRLGGMTGAHTIDGKERDLLRLPQQALLNVGILREDLVWASPFIEKELRPRILQRWSQNDPSR